MSRNHRDIRGVAGLNEGKNLGIPWGHIRTILGKIKDVDVVLFYMTAYTENGNHPAPAGHPSTGGEFLWQMECCTT